MDSIESSVVELNRLILEKAPNFRPAVFPTHTTIDSILDICDCSEASPHKAQVQHWLEGESCSEDQIIFLTDFDYNQRVIRLIPRKAENDTEKILSSLEQMMAMLVSGADKNLLGIVDACFHEMNHVDEQADAAQTSLYEVCNLCYSLKVLISNIPGIKFMIGERFLPLSAADDLYAILKSASRPICQTVDMETIDDTLVAKEVKKRKKKRGGGGK